MAREAGVDVDAVWRTGEVPDRDGALVCRKSRPGSRPHFFPSLQLGTRVGHNHTADSQFRAHSLNSLWHKL